MLIYIPTHHTTIAHPKRNQQLPIPTGIPTDSRPIPVPGRKVTGTRTRAGGMGTLRVWVRVGVKLPTGYPCPTLLADVLYGDAEDPCTDVVLHGGVHALGTARTEGCFSLDDDVTILHRMGVLVLPIILFLGFCF